MFGGRNYYRFEDDEGDDFYVSTADYTPGNINNCVQQSFTSFYSMIPGAFMVEAGMSTIPTYYERDTNYLVNTAQMLSRYNAKHVADMSNSDFSKFIGSLQNINGCTIPSATINYNVYPATDGYNRTRAVQINSWGNIYAHDYSGSVVGVNSTDKSYRVFASYENEVQHAFVSRDGTSYHALNVSSNRLYDEYTIYCKMEQSVYSTSAAAYNAITAVINGSNMHYKSDIRTVEPLASHRPFDTRGNYHSLRDFSDVQVFDMTATSAIYMFSATCKSQHNAEYDHWWSVNTGDWYKTTVKDIGDWRHTIAKVYTTDIYPNEKSGETWIDFITIITKPEVVTNKVVSGVGHSYTHYEFPNLFVANSAANNMFTTNAYNACQCSYWNYSNVDISPSANNNRGRATLSDSDTFLSEYLVLTQSMCRQTGMPTVHDSNEYNTALVATWATTADSETHYHTADRKRTVDFTISFIK